MGDAALSSEDQSEPPVADNTAAPSVPEEPVAVGENSDHNNTAGSRNPGSDQANSDEVATTDTPAAAAVATDPTPAADFSDAFNNSTAPTSSSSSLPQTVFHVKWFESLLRKQPIIMQSVNGPCPLIAIVNCLLLQQKLDLPAETEHVSAETLCSVLGNYLLDRAQKRSTDHTEQYILDCLERFVQIQTGIDVNVRFSRVDGFEYTPELSLFDLAEVRLLHGWVVDPQDTILSKLTGDLTYNQLVEVTMNKSSSADTQEVSESLLLRDLLESSQLTVHGICEMNSFLQPGNLAVLFRNNHFSTITKQQDRLFVLVTDVGWLNQKNVIWETLDSTCNSSTFSDGKFGTGDPSPEALAAAAAADEEEQQWTQEEVEEQQKLWEQAKAAPVTTQILDAEQQQQQQQQQRSTPRDTKKTCSIM